MTLRHIRYLGHEGSVCDRPDLLDRPFVRIDMTAVSLGVCKICLQLLVANREKEASEVVLHFEGAANSGVLYMPAERNELDDLRPFRGIMYACAFSSVFWIALFLMLVLVGVVDISG